jgi:glyoxylase-like metal-dependent hydrolase (beta-lactamase superfamily II)
MQEIAPRLRRWTAWHDDWEEDVGAPAHVLITVYWHGRTTGAAAAGHVWASRRSSRPLRARGIDVTDSFRAGDDLPGGIQAFQTARAAEVVYWLPAQRALAIGDVLLGAGAKPGATDEPLRLCPERWLGKGTHADLRKSLLPLLDLPVERVLVSHGEPILSGGKQALADVVR